MQLQPILITQIDQLALVYSNYKSTFPLEERRSKHHFYQSLQNDNVILLGIYDENRLKGYFVIWSFKQFSFLEHFEIFAEFRNQKLGATSFEKLLENHPKILLEIEPSTTEIAAKREGFYKNLGFITISKSYCQPSYHEPNSKLPMYLMSNFSIENYTEYITEIYEKVYNYFPNY